MNTRSLVLLLAVLLATPAAAGPRTAENDKAIAGFWAWWATAQPAYVAAVGKEMPPKLIDDLSRQVARISPDLGWEFGAGRRATHGLALIPEGNASLRLLTELWARSAPPDDPTFEFHATRQPAPRETLLGMRVQLQGVADGFDFGRLRITATEDPGRRRIDVVVHHPAVTQLPHDQAGFLSFLALDSAIGEAAVESWIGSVEWTAEPAPAGWTLVQLTERVAQLPTAWPPGTATWLLGQGADDRTGKPLLYVLDQGLKRWEAPTHDMLCTAYLTYRGQDNGMPTVEIKDRLDAVEDGLVAHGAGSLSHRGHRYGLDELQVYVFVDGQSDTEAKLRSYLKSHAKKARLVCESDAGWDKAP